MYRLERFSGQSEGLQVYRKHSMLPKLPKRELDSHKGTYGRVLVIAGSRGMSGAAILTGQAALRGGSGLVCVATPDAVQPIVTAGEPCYTTLPLGNRGDEFLSRAALPIAVNAVASVDVVALGPGMGQRAETTEFIHDFLTERTAEPMVVDADALIALSMNLKLIRERSVPLILTPHPGEFAFLCGRSISEIQAYRSAIAAEFAAQHKAILLLKGHQTVITDGTRTTINTTGNPGMATGGSGDVLTGLLAAFVAQGMSPYDATVLAAWVHGKAGDEAAKQLGQTALIARDLIDFLPVVLKDIEQR